MEDDKVVLPPRFEPRMDAMSRSVQLAPMSSIVRDSKRCSAHSAESPEHDGPSWHDLKLWLSKAFLRSVTKTCRCIPPATSNVSRSVTQEKSGEELLLLLLVPLAAATSEEEAGGIWAIVGGPLLAAPASLLAVSEEV
jgi:hypothetical protein